jgi:hypothetical protein
MRKGKSLESMCCLGSVPAPQQEQEQEEGKEEEKVQNGQREGEG